MFRIRTGAIELTPVPSSNSNQPARYRRPSRPTYPISSRWARRRKAVDLGNPVRRASSVTPIGLLFCRKQSNRASALVADDAELPVSAASSTSAPVPFGLLTGHPALRYVEWARPCLRDVQFKCNRHPAFDIGSTAATGLREPADRDDRTAGTCRSGPFGGSDQPGQDRR